MENAVLVGLITPAQPGVYIIKSVNTQGETQAQTMIVE